MIFWIMKPCNLQVQCLRFISTFRTTLPVTQFKIRRQHFAHNFLYPHTTVHVAMTRSLGYGQQELIGRRTQWTLLLTYPVTRNPLEPFRMCFAESSFMTLYGLRKGQSSMELNTLECYSFIPSFVNMTRV